MVTNTSMTWEEATTTPVVVPVVASSEDDDLEVVQGNRVPKEEPCGATAINQAPQQEQQGGPEGEQDTRCMPP